MTGIRAILAGINAQCTQFIDQNAASAAPAPARDSGTHADRDDLYHIVSAIAEVAGRIDSLAGEVASLSKRLSQSRERPQGNPTETLIAEVRRAQLAQERRISASLGAMHGALERIAERLGRSDALFPPRAQVVPTEREDGETFHPFQDRGLTFPLEDTAFQDEALPPRSGLLDPRPMLAAARAAARRALSEAELSALQAPSRLRDNGVFWHLSRARSIPRPGDALMTIDWSHLTLFASLLGGSVIGLAAALFMILHGRIMGVSGILSGFVKPLKGDRVWRFTFLAGLVSAPLLAQALGLLTPGRIEAGYGQLILAGLLVGFGTTLGSGCTSGHGVCGIARLSPRSIIATLVFVGAGIATVALMRQVGGRP